MVTDAFSDGDSCPSSGLGDAHCGVVAIEHDYCGYYWCYCYYFVVTVVAESFSCSSFGDFGTKFSPVTKEEMVVIYMDVLKRGVKCHFGPLTLNNYQLTSDLSFLTALFMKMGNITYLSLCQIQVPR